PNTAISVIPRLRASSSLLSIGNYIASSYFQRNGVRAGTGTSKIGFYQSRSGDHEGNGPRDHERTGTRDYQRKESRAGDQEGYCASNHDRNGASNQKKIGASKREQPDEVDRARTREDEYKKTGPTNRQRTGASVCDRAGATNRETKQERSDTACYPLQLQNPGGQKGINSRHHALLSQADRLPVCQDRSAPRWQADASGDDRAGTGACPFALDVLALCQRGIARFRRDRFTSQERTRERRRAGPCQ